MSSHAEGIAGYGRKARRDGKAKYIGIFDAEEDAARAYDAFAIANYGEFARPNLEVPLVP